MIPLVLPQHSWPETDQKSWDQLFLAQDMFDDPGPAAKWSAGTRKKRQQGYGQWLSYLARCDRPALNEPPANRITLDRVRAYLAECESRLSPKSVANLFSDLYALACMLDTEADWVWLKRASYRLNGRANTQSLPAAPDITAQQIYQWSLDRLKGLHQQNEGTARHRAVLFRRALLVGFMIARPVRRRAVAAMRVGVHLMDTKSGITLCFGAEDMKDKRERSFPLPEGLVPHMRTYLSTHRPALLGDRCHDAVWVTHHGKPFKADGIASDVEATSTRFLGIKLHPHAFRYVAATSIAEVDPEHVGIIRDILGHATLDMAEKHYNRATGISSCNALQSIVEDIVRDMPRMRGAKPAAPTARTRGGRT